MSSKRIDIKANVVTTLEAVSELGSVIADRNTPFREDESGITFPVCLVYLGQGTNIINEASLGWDMWLLPIVVHVVTLEDNAETLYDLVYEAMHVDTTRGSNVILTQSTDGIEFELGFDLPSEAIATTVGFEVKYEVAHGTI